MSKSKASRPRPSSPNPVASVSSHKSASIPKTVSSSEAFGRAMQDLRHPQRHLPDVSGRWVVGALLILLTVGLACAWGTLCLLYWQGSWQLLYHPKAEITRTPAAVGLPFEAVKFAATETGVNRLTGWWVPAEGARFTVLYLHGADGNLSDTVETLAAFHAAGLSVFAIDYRGYGLSQSALLSENRPSEKQLRQDAEWALTWLTLTRSTPARTVIVAGTRLGADLAAELARDHSEVAGVLLDQPIQNATEAIFADSRSRLVPAHWLMQDRYDLTGAAGSLNVPSLWLFARKFGSQMSEAPAAYSAASKQKSAAWLTSPSTADPHFAETMTRWLDDLR